LQAIRAEHAGSPEPEGDRTEADTESLEEEDEEEEEEEEEEYVEPEYAGRYFGGMAEQLGLQPWAGGVEVINVTF
jgi:hypothetical protein